MPAESYTREPHGLAKHFPHFDSDINDLPDEGMEEWKFRRDIRNAELLGSPVQVNLGGLLEARLRPVSA
jgi:hypothetical protein